MSDRKRKSTSIPETPPSKRQQVAGNIKVRHVPSPGVMKPVIASSPGLTLPDVKFYGYTKSEKNGTTQLLLASNEHPTISHTAREDDVSTESHLKHYVAVFEPETGRLEVTEAKRLTVRSAIKTAVAVREEDQNEAAVPSNQSSRRALTETFGTKKSKKAAQSMQENNVLAQGDEEVNDSISAAMLSKVEEDSSNQDNLIREALQNKPLPPANLDTNEIDQVYPYKVLVWPGPPTKTLGAMPVDGWTARVRAKKDVSTRSRFVASRIGYVIQKLLSLPDNTDSKFKTALQVLRYIELLLDLHRYVARLPKRRPFSPVDKWPEDTMSKNTPMSLVKPIANHFFPDHTPKDQAITLLRTTILALTLHIPLPKDSVKGMLVTEPTDISMDMAIEASEIRRLFRELGCRISPASDSELEHWGLEKPKKEKDSVALPKAAFVRLRFPLDFPKVSRGRAPARK